MDDVVRFDIRESVNYLDGMIFCLSLMAEDAVEKIAHCAFHETESNDFLDMLCSFYNEFYVVSEVSALRVVPFTYDFFESRFGDFFLNKPLNAVDEKGHDSTKNYIVNHIVDRVMLLLDRLGVDLKTIPIFSVDAVLVEREFGSAAKNHLIGVKVAGGWMVFTLASALPR